MFERNEGNLNPDQIRVKIHQGASLRESGDYQNGERELKEAFDLSRKSKDSVLAMEAGNQLSIQYRLIAGRAGRAGDLVQAEQYSVKSFRVYDQLEQQELLNTRDPIVIRNRSHALLYAGYIDEAIPALQHSAEIQPNPASQGDEFCHLASAYLEAGNTKNAEFTIDKGLELIKSNNGSLIALTYGLMTESSILSKTGQAEKAVERLREAQQIAEDNNLAVREEEIQFLLGKPTDDINVLEAVSGDLKIIRDLEKEISESWEKPEKISDKPIALVMGGFQGSGKSSILEMLRQDLRLIIISADQIRQIMFDRGIKFSARFSQIVEATSAALFRRAMNSGYSVASDSNITPQRITAFKNFQTTEGFANYNLVMVYIDVSEDSLRKRVQNRTSQPGKYTGKVEELEASIKKHGQIDQSFYDLVLDGEKLTLDQEAQAIKDRVLSLEI